MQAYFLYISKCHGYCFISKIHMVKLIRCGCFNNQINNKFIFCVKTSICCFFQANSVRWQPFFAKVVRVSTLKCNPLNMSVPAVVLTCTEKCIAANNAGRSVNDECSRLRGFIDFSYLQISACV